MGDPRRVRRKYARPRHPWERGRIENEKRLIKEYGLKNKKEIWKMNSLLKSFKDQAKKLNAMEGEQAEREKEQLMKKLNALGILPEGAPLDDVLGLGIESVMERRLQTVVYRKGMAKSADQARQFVVHEHVKVDEDKVTVPSYLVRVNEDVKFADNSPLQDEMHPERVEKKPSKTKIEEKEEEKEDVMKKKKKEEKEEEAEDEEGAEESEEKEEKKEGETEDKEGEE